MDRPERPRLKDVARHASVSPTTVSIVLNGKAGAAIPAETQARVLAAAAELGYRPNAMARSLRRQRSDTIGVVSDEIATTPFAGAMLLGAQQAAWEHGVVLLLVDTGKDAAIERRALDLLLDRQVDAIVVATMAHEEVDPPIGLGGTPAVLLNARARDGSLPSVVPDEVAAARQAVELLVAHGHRRIGHLSTADLGPAAWQRRDGYLAVLAAHGIAADPDLIAVGAHGDVAGGVLAASRLFDLPDRPTALFCFNDRMAFGAYRAARYRGLRIPEDVSIVGFDDAQEIAPWLDPPLSTMALPHAAMGRWAVEQVLGALADGGGTAVQQRLPCPLVERGSVARPAAS